MERWLKVLMNKTSTGNVGRGVELESDWSDW